MSGIDAIAVGVPARDEQDRISACVDALLRAAREVEVACASLRSAGAARAAAIDAALGGAALATTWVATTDADTIVDPLWLATHLAWARSGVDGIAGLVQVSWEEHGAELPARYAASLLSDGTAVGHHHVHGANLGVRADRWRAVGGCGTGTEGEDHELWARLRASGALLLGVDDLLVHTSDRLSGRTPGGFAGYLTRLIEPDDSR